MRALEEEIKAGNIDGIALSEVSAATIERAVKLTKIVAVEVELSLWSLDILSNGVCNHHRVLREANNNNIFRLRKPAQSTIFRLWLILLWGGEC
jgi:diketogulonate reductase-like aldo/keto reductase